jgi:hypothetical protein
MGRLKYSFANGINPENWVFDQWFVVVYHRLLPNRQKVVIQLNMISHYRILNLEFTLRNNIRIKITD